MSVIRVFFGQRETWQYKQDVSFYWFEIFSKFKTLILIIIIIARITAKKQKFYGNIFLNKRI